MTDQKIKRYQLEFQVEDSGVFFAKRDNFAKVVTDIARNEGYVPLLDLPTFSTVDYRQERFYFTVTVQTVFVGKRKAWVTDGMLHGRLVEKSIRETKSDP